MINALSLGLRDLVEQGGFVMPGLILLSLVLFTALFRLLLELFLAWRMPHPVYRVVENGPSSGLQPQEMDDVALVRERAEWRLHFDRRLKFGRILTSAAPLLGLLGTVAGMLKTFSALGLREGLKTIDLVASGISEALITTETGLSIAIAGLALLWVLKGCRRRLLLRFEAWEAAYALSQYQRKTPC